MSASDAISFASPGSTHVGGRTALIDQATRRVTLIGYAAYRLPLVSLHLTQPSPEASRSTSSSSHPKCSRAVAEPTPTPTFGSTTDPSIGVSHRRQTSRQSRHSGRSERVADERHMTSAAYDKNIELGILCRGGGVAAQVQRHFDELIACSSAASLARKGSPSGRPRVHTPRGVALCADGGGRSRARNTTGPGGDVARPHPRKAHRHPRRRLQRGLHLGDVLDRIPDSRGRITEILVGDDASQDSTHLVASATSSSPPTCRSR